MVLTTAFKPVDLLWRTGLSLVTSFVDGLLGRFDEAKYTREPRSTGFTVGVTDQTGQKKLGACVRKNGDTGNQLLIRNGLAVPFRFSAPGVAGLTPNLAVGELELVAFARGMSGLMTGDVYAAGLDLAGDVPRQFTVTGELSWVAALVDLAMGLLTVVLPVGRAVTVGYRAVLMKVREKLVLEKTRLSYQRITEILEVVVR